jgi:protein-L-isoaspartate(D-aspartate) O-methyltransferase
MEIVSNLEYHVRIMKCRVPGSAPGTRTFAKLRSPRRWGWIAAVAVVVLFHAPIACGPQQRDAKVGNLTERRLRMVDTQIRSRGIRDEKVLEAMEQVPRHEFVPESSIDQAYEDHPLSIGQGQTISQPYIVALMTEVLELEPDDRVLEIGTGSGYQAAILSRLAAEVYSIEIIESLGLAAAARLDSLGYDNVKVRIGDGYLGWPEKAPFDAVIVTAAPERIPQALVDQLAEGGRMVLPVGVGIQDLVLVEKHEGKITQREITGVRFVPMVHGNDSRQDD